MKIRSAGQLPATKSQRRPPQTTKEAMSYLSFYLSLGNGQYLNETASLWRKMNLVPLERKTIYRGINVTQPEFDHFQFEKDQMCDIDHERVQCWTYDKKFAVACMGPTPTTTIGVLLSTITGPKDARVVIDTTRCAGQDVPKERRHEQALLLERGKNRVKVELVSCPPPPPIADIITTQGDGPRKRRKVS